jgi:hypothetical protein
MMFLFQIQMNEYREFESSSSTIHVTYSEMRFRLGSACFSFAVRDVTS